MKVELVREPAVAGRFYPARASELRREIDGLLGPSAGSPALAVVGPHAGYVYSGAIAGEAYARVEVPMRVILLGPNHTGMGARRALWARGAWKIPGDLVPIDEQLAERVRRMADLEDDHRAHQQEHSLEVHLPFLRARQPHVSLVPICLGPLELEECRSIGHGIASAVRETDGEVLLVASTDMSHYISAEAARERDQMALARVQELDPEGLYRTVTRHDISMCGFIPTTVALFAALELGAEHAELVRYGNSGDVSGDYQRVVGYAGLVVS